MGCLLVRRLKDRPDDRSAAIMAHRPLQPNRIDQEAVIAQIMKRRSRKS